MKKDYGIVFLPNADCTNFANHMTSATARKLPSYKQAENNPHITAYHIANVDFEKESMLRADFKSFCSQYRYNHIDLPIRDINATGGSLIDGYKWLDLQFETLPKLVEMRQNAIDTFSSYHEGMLSRMQDDMNSYNQSQIEDVAKHGVITANYLPHVTAWYVDLPHESKTAELENIANDLKSDMQNLTCWIEAIALVELGRNGNVINIIDAYYINI